MSRLKITTEIWSGDNAYRMSDGSSFVKFSTFAFACCASRPSLESVGSKEGGVQMDDLGVDVEVVGAEEVSGTAEALGLVEPD